MQKSDKLGIHGLLEQKVLVCLELAISASYAPLNNKLEYLEKLRTDVEVCKHLLRTESELGIITEKSYIFVTAKLIEISKQITGWIKYIETKNRTP